MQRLVAAVAGLLEATERRGHVTAIVLVDPHAADAQRLGRQMRLGQVAGPDRCRQTIDAVVGDLNGFLGGVEGDHREHRAKDLFGGDAHAVGHVVENGRLDIHATGLDQGALAATEQLGVFGMAGFDIGQHAVEVTGIDQGAHSGGRVEGVTGFPAFHGFQQQRHEFIFHRALDQQTRARGAHLALVEADRRSGSLGSGFQARCIGEDDVGALATRFQPDALHVRFAGVDHQLLGDLGRAGEHQGVDVHVQGQSLAHGVTEARQDVQHAGRDTSFEGQLGQANGGQRRLLGRFDDHRVTGRQGRAEFPAGHDQREVPRHDGRHHAHRLTGDQAQFVVRSGRHFVVDLVDRFTAPADRPRGARHVDAQGIADRLAHIEGFQQGQLFGVSVHQIGEADHDFLALDRLQPRPHARLEGGAGIGHGQFGIGQVAAGNLAQQAAIDRTDAIESGFGHSVGGLAVDKGAAFNLQLLGTLLPVGAGQGSHGSVLFY